MAPLNGAVVGEAIVKVEGNRKSVQHLDGGVIKELRVEDGDHVKEGDILVVLDDTQLRAEFDILSQQYAMLKATEARLTAELANSDAVAFPAELTESTRTLRQDRHSGAAARIRKPAHRAERRGANPRLPDLQTQGAKSPKRGSGESVRRSAHIGVRREGKPRRFGQARPGDEAAHTAARKDRGGLQGRWPRSERQRPAALQSIGEYCNRLRRSGRLAPPEITKELSETQAKLLDVILRLHNATVSLGRTEIRSPMRGEVVGLSVFSVGGVIGRGEKILGM